MHQVSKTDNINIDLMAQPMYERCSKLAQEAYGIYSSEVDIITNSQSLDISHIEKTLDNILGFCFDLNMLNLFKKLCRYYYFIDKVAAADYVKFYREMWDDAYNA